MTDTADGVKLSEITPTLVRKGFLANGLTAEGKNATFDISKLNDLKDVAVPSGSPGTLDGACSFFASAVGTYTNFGGLVIETEGLYLFMWNGTAWSMSLLISTVSEKSGTITPVDDDDDEEETGTSTTIKVATPSTTNPDITATYFVSDAGDYSAFGLTMTKAGLAVFKHDGTDWNKETIIAEFPTSTYTGDGDLVVSSEVVEGDSNAVSGGAVATALNAKISAVSNNLIVNSFIKEIYCDFSGQSVYSKSDITKCTIERAKSNDWCILLWAGSNVVTGGHWSAESFDVMAVTRNSIPMKVVVDWKDVNSEVSLSYNATFSNLDNLDFSPTIRQLLKNPSFENLTAVENTISSVSSSITVNAIVKEIYCDFSGQTTYSKDDISIFRIGRAVGGNDWFVFLLDASNTIIAGGHVYGKEVFDIIEVTRASTGVSMSILIDWGNVPSTGIALNYSAEFSRLDNLDFSAAISGAKIAKDTVQIEMDELALSTSPQISDGLSLTSASAAQIAFDETAALVGVASQAAWLDYGESYQQIRLDLFQLNQPLNVRHVIVAKDGENIADGVVFAQSGEVNVLAIGGRVFRTMFQHGGHWFYRDYNFDTDTLDDAVAMQFKQHDGSLVNLNLTEKKAYVSNFGYDDSASTATILTSSYYRDGDTGRVYGCWTGYNAYPILFYSDDNLATITPFAVYPEKAQYEASIVYNGARLHIITRATNSVAYSDDDGSNWTISALEGSDNNRPRLYLVDDKVVWAHGVSGRSRYTAKIGDNFDASKTLFDISLTEYGLVYPSFLFYNSKMYMAYSDGSLGFDPDWNKDCVRFAELGDIL